MRIIVWILVSVAILVSSGCAVIEKETTNRGGYLDYLLDEHWMKADSKGMRALRAFAIQVSLSRLASVSAKNDSDRQLLAIRIGALTKRFTPIYACAFDQNPLGVPGAESDPCFYYDSAMVDYSNGLFDLAMVALPVDDAKRLINAVTGSALNPINLGDLLEALLAIARDALKYGRVVGALYRDTVELEVQVWLATPAIDDRPPPFRVTADDVAPLRAIYASRNDDMPAWLAAIAALRSQGLEPLPDRKFFAELGGLMKYICGLITQDHDTLKKCQEGLPTTLPPAKPVLSTGMRVVVGTVIPAVHALRESIPSSPREKLPGVSGPGPKLDPFIMGAQTDVERKLRVPSGQQIQSNLCVSVADGNFGTETREAILQAKLAANMSRTAKQAPPLFSPVNSQIGTNDEAQIFLGARHCAIDRSGIDRAYATAYEKFGFPDETAIKGLQKTLAKCDANVKQTGIFDKATRNGILAATSKAGSTVSKTDRLNNMSYDSVSGLCI